MIPKTIKSFLKQLKEIGEDTYMSHMAGESKLTKEEWHYLSGIICAIQNELGEMPDEIWKKFNVEPYDGRVK